MAAEATHVPAPAQFRIGPRRAGVFLFVSSESIVFFSIIATYAMDISANPNLHPISTDALQASRMIPYSVALWLSSGTIWLASRWLARGSQIGARFWLLLTFGLGCVFLGGEMTEWAGLFHAGITASTNAWSTAFFTLTGLHGLHVTVGLLIMLALFGTSFRWALAHDREAVLELFSIYWHFVDGMWVVIYGVVYFWAFLNIR